MSRYVDVDKLHNQGWVAARYKNWEPTPLNDNFKLEVEVKPFITFPAADVVEVRHGRWLFTREKTGLPKWTCSVCGGDGRGDYLRCPWCAAKMGKMGDNR